MDIENPTPAPEPTPTPKPTPAPAPSADGTKSMLSPNAGGTQKHWIDDHVAEVKSLNTLRKFNSVDDALIAYANLEKLATTKGLQAPSPDDSEELRQTYLNTRRGGIKDAKDYTIKAEAMQEYGVSNEAFENLRNDMFALGLSDKEACGVMEMLANFQLYEIEQYKRANAEQFENCNNQFKNKYGNQASEIIKDIQNLLKEEAGETLLKQIQDTGLDNSFEFLEFLNKFVKKTKDGGAPRNHGDTLESRDAKSQLQTLMQSPEYKNPNHPNHAQAQLKFMKLLNSTKMEDLT